MVECETGVDKAWLDAEFAIDVNGVIVPAATSLRPLYDPDGVRPRS